MLLFRHVLVACAMVSLVGCSSVSDTVSDLNPWGGEKEEKLPKPENSRSAEEIYKSGLSLVHSGSYKKATDELDDIERLYPYSPLATRSQVMIAYAYYKDNRYDEALSTINRFIKLNPGNKDIAYMYYLKALSYYERITDVKRDQQITHKSLQALNELMKRFPDSDYSRDAALKIDLVYDHLAGKEMEIGRYYLKQNKYLAAARRFDNVLQKYETTSHAPEALYRLVEAYLAMGVEPEARKYAAVLGHNYSDNKWYRYAYRLIEDGENAPEETWYEAYKPMSGKVKLAKNSKVDTWFTEIFSWAQ